MTQNASDVEIANQGFAAFRQDLNDVLEDITTLHSGDTAPSTTYANQFWYETDTDKLYIRNEDNDAWIEILTLDQANDHLATLGATITLDGSGNASIDGTFDVNGNELILDTDGDTSITADTDDQIDFKTGGTDRMQLFNDAHKFSVGAAWEDNTSTGLDAYQFGDYSGNASILLKSGSASTGAISFAESNSTRYGGIFYNHTSESMGFFVNNGERMSIDSSGNFLFKTTNTNPPANNQQGASFRNAAGQMLINAGSAHAIGRTGDGSVVDWYSGGNKEGQVSISGSTVSYGGFTGSHWSRLSDNTKPTILRGTVLESIGTMMDWYYAEFTTGSGDDAETHKVSCAQPANKNAGDTFDFVVADDNEQDIAAGTYSATLRLEDDMKHVKVKVSDTSETKAIYGVFGSWDDEDDTVNDMNISSLGTYVVRVNSGETVAIGDLLDSNGDGTAKVQSDDLIRSRTIGKVLSTVKQETYSDGSYTVPCALYCG